MNTTNCDVFVVGFSDRTSKRQLQELFSRFGKVNRVTIITKFGQKPYGFVNFSTEEEADRAVQCSGTIKFFGSLLEVNHAYRPRSELPTPTSSVPQSSTRLNEYIFELVIFPLPQSMLTPAQVALKVLPIAQTDKVLIANDPDTKIPIAFVSLVDQSFEQKVISSLSGQVVEGVKLTVQKNAIRVPLKIFFKGFQPTTSQDSIFNYFKQFGEIDITSSYCIDGSGFVIFFTPFGAQKCVIYFDHNNTKDNGSLIYIYSDPGSVPESIPQSRPILPVRNQERNGFHRVVKTTEPFMPEYESSNGYKLGSISFSQSNDKFPCTLR